MGIPRIFVSSTFKDLELEREYVQIVCRDLGFDVMYYPEQSPAGSPNGFYMEKLHECHVLIYMATGASAAVDRELDAASRRGIPVIELAKIDPATGNISTTALTRRSVSPRFQVAFRSLDDIRRRLTESLQDIIYKRFESGKRLVSFGPAAYAFAAQAADSATFRLGVVQETPTLILGPDKKKFVEESPFYAALKKMLLDVEAGRRDLQFIYLFDAERTRKEIANRRDQYPQLSQALDFIQANSAIWSSNPNVVVKAMEGPLTASVVHDTSLEISTVLRDDRYYLWLDEVGGAANDFWTILQHLAMQGTDLGDFVKTLPP